MMAEVHKNIPSTVPAHVKKNPSQLRRMLAAIAYSKARRAGAKV